MQELLPYPVFVLLVWLHRFPKAPDRTRKWLHLDDLTGTVFRHQMTLVSIRTSLNPGHTHS